MHVLTSQLVAHAKNVYTKKLDEYESAGPERAFWMMVDLRSSTAYRQFAGSKNAFVRGEVFVEMVRELCGLYSRTQVMKELGDGLLVKATSLRELLEIACLLHAIKRGWPSFDSRGDAPSLDYGAYMTYGDCVQLNRNDAIDYVGTPLDELARVSSYKNSDPSIVLTGSFGAFQAFGEVFDELPFLSMGPPELLEASLQKAGEKRIRIVRITIDTERFDGFDRYFNKVRERFDTAR